MATLKLGVKNAAGALTSAGLVTLLLLGAVIPLAFSFAYFISALYPDLHLYFFQTAGLAIAFFLIVKVLYSAPLNRPVYLMVLAGLAAVTFFLRWKFVTSFDQAYISDFETMWARAVEVAESGRWSPPVSPQTERPLASLVPLAWLFGESDLVFKAFNITAITLQNLVFAGIAAHWFSRHAGILCFLLLSLVPESYFASLIPSHDIAGSLYLSLYLALYLCTVFPAGRTRWWTLLLKLAGLVAIGLLLDIQRELHAAFTVGALAFFLFTAATLADRWKLRPLALRTSLAIIIPFFAVASVKATLTANDILYDRHAPEIAWNSLGPFCYFHAFSNGNYNTCREFYDRYAEPMEYADRVYYGRALAVSDLYYNIASRPENYLQRLASLVRFGTQGYFYYGRLHGVSKQEQLELNLDFAVLNRLFNVIFSLAALLAAGFLTFSRKVRTSINPVVYLPVIVFSVITLALALISESQPRYLFFAPLLLALPIVGIVDSRGSTAANTDPVRFNPSLFVSVPVLLLLIAGAFHFGARHSGLLLVDMRRANLECSTHYDSLCSGAIVAPAESDNGKNWARLALRHPDPGGVYAGGWVRAGYRLPVEPSRNYALTLYVQSPYLSSDRKTGSIEINIYAGGRLLKTLSVGDTQDDRFVRIDNLSTPEDRLEITLEILTHVGYRNPSWQQATLANFRFMALRIQ